jgi:type II secretory pathway pseudopilin PulG
MLVVVVIIGILAGLITGAVSAARSAARRAVTLTEISGLQTALTAYKEKFGDYPPNFPDNDADDGVDMNDLHRHFAKAFPRYPAAQFVDPNTGAPAGGPNGNIRKWQWDLKAWFIDYFQNQRGNKTAPVGDWATAFVGKPASVDPMTGIITEGPDPTGGGLSPSMALAFWLGGLPDANGNPTGFSANRSNPFDATTAGRIGPFFEFDMKRLHRPDGADAVPSEATDPTSFFQRFFLRYFPKNGNPDSHPYVYFGRRYYRTSVGKPAMNASGTGLDSKDCPIYPFTSDANGDPMRVRPYFEQSQIAQLSGLTPAALANYLQQGPPFSHADSIWCNASTCQILCPGLDGKYLDPSHVDGSGNVLQPGNTFPTGDDYLPEQYDDLTNFSGGTLKDAMP